MASGGGGGKCKAADRNKKKCDRYKAQGRLEKNKARKAAKNAKRSLQDAQKPLRKKVQKNPNLYRFFDVVLVGRFRILAIPPYHPDPEKQKNFASRPTRIRWIRVYGRNWKEALQGAVTAVRRGEKIIRVGAHDVQAA